MKKDRSTVVFRKRKDGYYRLSLSNAKFKSSRIDSILESNFKELYLKLPSLVIEDLQAIERFMPYSVLPLVELSKYSDSDVNNFNAFCTNISFIALIKQFVGANIFHMTANLKRLYFSGVITPIYPLSVHLGPNNYPELARLWINSYLDQNTLLNQVDFEKFLVSKIITGS